MMILAYFAEGVVRAGTDSGTAAALALAELLLALEIFGSDAFTPASAARADRG